MIDSSTRALLTLLAGLISMSATYFLCLVLGAPFVACVGLLAGVGVVLWTYLRFLGAPAEPAKPSWPAVLLLLCGVFLITNRSYYLAVPWGDWDAWAMWNYHARFLLDSGLWKNLFQSVSYDHPDYPLGLPSAIACTTRLCGRPDIMLISFGLHFLITLTIPILIFTAIRGKSLLVAGIILVVFATDDNYLFRGTSQYADTLFAAILLAAIITIGAGKNDKRMLLPAAFFAAALGWIKNEGVVLTLLFFVFFGGRYLNRYGWKCLITGIALPLSAIAIFKLGFAPANDLFRNSHGQAANLLDAGRYSMIWEALRHNTTEKFMPLAILLLLYVGASAYLRKWPERSMIFLFACLGTYLLTYVLTPYNLEWHLSTSQDRLLHQLMPAMVFIIGERLASLPLFGVRRKHAF